MADLQFSLENLDGLSDEAKGFYTETNGQFALNVSGVKPLAEFQTVMGSLEAERLDHKTTKGKLGAFGGKTPADMLALTTKIMELEAAGGGELDKSKIDELVKQRLIPFEQQATTAETTISELNAQVESMQANALSNDRERVVIGILGEQVKPEFHKDLTYRAERELTWNPDLKAFVDTLGASATEWAARQLRETPSWCVPSNGSGVKGGGRPGNASVNPFAKGKDFNLTNQSRMMREDPKKAAQLQAQALAASD